MYLIADGRVGRVEPLGREFVGEGRASVAVGDEDASVAVVVEEGEQAVAVGVGGEVVGLDPRGERRPATVDLGAAGP